MSPTFLNRCSATPAGYVCAGITGCYCNSSFIFSFQVPGDERKAGQQQIHQQVLWPTERFKDAAAATG